jgi:hypothetical protein
MTFIQDSPARQLRALFPIIRTSANKRVGDWSEFHVGDRVYDKADPRHVGRIDSIENSAFANITWEETGWKSVSIPLRDLEHATEDY